MASPPLLLLIGLRCSGKTTLGQAVTKAVALPFRDLDPLALTRLGAASVGEAFERHGEAGWRRAESEALHEALQDARGGVLALGGGSPTAPGAASLIRASQSKGASVVALLHPGPDELIRRLGATRGDRPRLDTDDHAEVRRLSEERLPFYRSLADATVDTRRPASACVTRLAALLRTSRWPWPSSPASG